MDKTISVSNGSEAFIELLNDCGVDYIFLNPGTDTFPVQEAVCKFKALGKRTPEVVLCLHESVAMAAAHGYFMISGKPQVVFVHADLGPQQVGGALHNAQRGRIGVVLCAGRVPSSIEKRRLNPVHWFQEQFDQAGVVRGYVKWSYELRSNENIHHVVQRAFQVASTEPAGPVFLSLPQDLLEEKIVEVLIPDSNRHSSVDTSGIDDSLLSKIATLLIEANNPIIVTDYSGRHLSSVRYLIELAEILGARVFTSQTTMNFPTKHSLFSGFFPNQNLSNTDLMLIIDCDIPYVSALFKPKADARVIQIDMDALKQNMPLWGFTTDILVQADSSKVLPALVQLIRKMMTSELQQRFQTRFQLIKNEHDKLKQNWEQQAISKASSKPISPEWLCYCLNQILDEGTILLEEAVTNRASLFRQIDRSQPATFFRSGGSNLGWGLGAAIGTKLANRDKTVVTVVGDGSFVFGCPTAALWTAGVNNAPFLCVILNNMQYTAPKIVLKQVLGPDCYSVKTGNYVGTSIYPSPDYAAVARACNAYGQIVEDPLEIIPALKQALEYVRLGKPAVLDVRVEIP